MRFYITDIVILMSLVDISLTLIPNVTSVVDINNELRGVETRRRKKNRERSTSSSEQARDKDKDSETDKESLELSTHELTSTSVDSDKPVSTEERRGWRKWHRKCTPCPEDMAKKWREQSIEWICGAYQRARRSFKSECMMHYRNCQDGTMFVKIHDHRCANDTRRDQPHGLHFFYDYKVNLPEDSSDNESESSDTLSEDSSGSD